MLSVTIVFLLFSAVVFFGYILYALFERIRIAVVLPLMLIGFIVGPLLGLVGTIPDSTVVQLAPYITAIAIAFVLFDVGMNIRLSKLEKVIVKATEFTFALAIVTGIISGTAIFFVTHWNIIIAFICGFAIAGPSSVILPTIMKITKANERLKSALVFESVVTDSVQLIIPIILFTMMQSNNINFSSAFAMLFNFFVSSTFFGILSALFWVFILKRFRQYSESYSWMLTMTMVVATYGVASSIGLSGAVSTFVFGMAIANMPYIDILKDYVYDIKKEFIHIKDYQKEITFFVSTFFFVYIGVLFQIGQATPVVIAAALLVSVIVLLLRPLFIPIIGEFFNRGSRGSEKVLASFDVARGLSPTIVATMPVALGIVIPGFVDTIFLIILFTNIIATTGLFLYAGKAKAERIKIVRKPHR